MEILETYVEYDNELYQIIKKCLHTNPQKRFSIEELYDIMKNYINCDHIRKKYH